MGEPAGIGGELTLKAWAQHRNTIPPFFVLDDIERLRSVAASIGLPVPVEPTNSVEEALSVFQNALPCLPVPLAVPSKAGRPEPKNAEAVLESIRQAVDLCQAGDAAAIVTQPIQKSTLYAAGFQHPGHTEYLAELSGFQDTSPVMMLAGPNLRAVPATIHIPLNKVPAALTVGGLAQTLATTARGLRELFGIPHPRIAVAGLNPHAGENGNMGLEEQETIVPAISQAQAVTPYANFTGPHPGDTLFHAKVRTTYDAVVAMFHDQALIPAKTLDFDRTVNLTLGLSIIRTSPDHGTALDIAGTGKADPTSFLEALRLAGDLAYRKASA